MSIADEQTNIASPQLLPAADLLILSTTRLQQTQSKLLTNLFKLLLHLINTEPQTPPAAAHHRSIYL